MTQQSLSSLELLFLAAMNGAEKVYGVPDRFSLLSEEEKAEVRQELMTSLMAKGLLDMDLDGKLTTTAEADEVADLIAHCDCMLAINHAMPGSGQRDTAVWRRMDMLIAAEIKEDVYTLREATYDEVSTLLDALISRDADVQDGEETASIPQVVLKQAKACMERDDGDAAIKLLSEYGASEKMAERITDILFEKTEFISAAIWLPNDNEQRLQNIVFAHDNGGIMTMSTTVEDFQTRAVFTPVDAEKLRGALNDMRDRVYENAAE